MTYQSKRTVFSLIIGVGILVAYSIYGLGKYNSSAVGAGDIAFWAKTMLIFIGLSIVANIVLQILFHIGLSIGIAVKERENDEKTINRRIAAEMVEDEMDKLIQLKSLRIGFALAGVGFIGALIVIAFGHPAVLALNIIYLSFNVGALAEGVTSLYYYGKGVSNG